MTIILIKSSTALVGFSVFILIYIVRMKWNIWVKPIWFLLFNVAFFIGIIILRLQNLFGFFIVDVLHKELTFTGRTFIWDQALLKILRHPLIGNGMTEFPIGSYFVATHPHNFMLYLLVKSGLIGFLLFAVSAVICAKKLEKNQDNKIAQILIMEYCSFFSMTVTESMTEAIFSGWLSLWGFALTVFMKRRMKVIGIVTPLKVNNYGTKLQAYAVQKKMLKFGFDSEIILYDRSKDLRISVILKKLFTLQKNMQRLKNIKNNRQLKKHGIDKQINARNKAIESLDETCYRCTEMIRGYDNLILAGKNIRQLFVEVTRCGILPLLVLDIQVLSLLQIQRRLRFRLALV